MRSILDLVEYLIFQVDPDGRIRAGNDPARALVDKLDGVVCQALFGLRTGADLITLSESESTLLVDVPLQGGQTVPLKWGLQRRTVEGGVALECVSANWEPIIELVQSFKDENLMFKELALNIIPHHITEELITKRAVRPRAYRGATILFTDVVSFSRIAFHLDPVSLVRSLNTQFSAFDDAMDVYGMEKIKTIGDAYMCVAGLPKKKKSHAVDAALTALNMVGIVEGMRKEPKLVEELDLNNWQIRVGLHSGPCISGVVGNKKYVFDIWGDSVNVAARMESASEPMQVNVSHSTYELIDDFFVCSHRGSQLVKNIGEIEMYFLERLRPEFSADERGLVVNEAFLEEYVARFRLKPTTPNLGAYPKAVRDHLAR